MSVLGRPVVASSVARVMQAVAAAGSGLAARRRATPFPDCRAGTRHLVIPAPVLPAPAVVYRPPGQDPCPPVHVNFHGGGYVMRGAQLDDPLCRYLAAVAGVVVVNVEYAVAPQHRFPVPTRQAYEVVRWVALNGAEHGWDGARLTVGGQSAGGALAAAVARQAWEASSARGDDGVPAAPRIALQVLQYPPLDLSIPARAKPAPIAAPVIRPWMGEVFDNSYVPDLDDRRDRLVSPAGAADTVDLTGIAPAVVITCAHDRLRAEGERYARRLAAVGALVEHHDVPDADHAYDLADPQRARPVYDLIAHHLRRATAPPPRG